MIRTVLGDVEPSECGTFSSHEHLICDQTMFATPSIHSGVVDVRKMSELDLAAVVKDPLTFAGNLALDEVPTALEELESFTTAGGQTIVDLTNEDFGRSPQALADLARRSGVNIVMGSGRYIDASRSEHSRHREVHDLAEEIIADINTGIDGVRAGVIGEIGCSTGIAPSERRALRAAAIAQGETGAAIAVHPPIPRLREAHAVLDLLEKEGANLSRVAVCHSDYDVGNLEYLGSLIERGAFVMFDRFGNSWDYLSNPGWCEPEDKARVDTIRCLVDAGHARQILIGQDVCMKVNLAAYGGKGYAHMLTTVESLFHEFGLDENVWRTITRENPQGFFALAR